MSHSSNHIAGWIRQQVTIAGARGLAVGLSGGIDSAVVVRLCQLAAPGNVVGVVMPCDSDAQDEADARMVADHFALPVVRMDLGPSYGRLVGELSSALGQLPPEQQPAAKGATDPNARMAMANVKPRLRMTALYFVANSLNYLVVGTGNRSELMIGYFTKHGDGGSDLLPIGRLLKSEVLELARELKVPDAIIEKAPSAGLWGGQIDEEEMGFKYQDLERYLTKGPDTVAPALAMRIERLIRASEHKRVLAPMPE